jgi:hypothetical protein
MWVINDHHWNRAEKFSYHLFSILLNTVRYAKRLDLNCFLHILSSYGCWIRDGWTSRIPRNRTLLRKGSHLVTEGRRDKDRGASRLYSSLLKNHYELESQIMKWSEVFCTTVSFISWAKKDVQHIYADTHNEIPVFTRFNQCCWSALFLKQISMLMPDPNWHQNEADPHANPNHKLRIDTNTVQNALDAAPVPYPVK